MLTLLDLNLTTFDGAAAGGEGMTGGNGNDGQASGQPANANTGTKKSGEYDNVIFGIQDNADNHTADDVATEPKTVEKTPKERRAEFESLIKGDYKEEFAKKFQDEFNKRHRGHKELEEKFNKADRIIGLLAERYGEYDIEKLEQKFLDDKAYLEQEAMERGMEVEQLAEIKRLKADADSERRRRERIEGERLADEQYYNWINQANELKKTFPDFDLNTEINNPAFNDLLQRGISVDHAYKVLHHDEILQASISDAIKQSSKATADSIAARGNRPKENGSTGSAVVYKTDVSKFTPKDRAEIAKRVAAGETIRF
jgi:hypothetical protein